MLCRAFGYWMNPSTPTQLSATAPAVQFSHYQGLLSGRMPSQSPTEIDPATPANKLIAIV